MNAPAWNRPGRLWSLWDIMRRFRIDKLWWLAAEYSDSHAAVFFAEPSGDDPGRPLNSAETEKLSVRLGRLKKVCEKLNLTTSAILVQHKINNLPRNSGEMDMLWLTVKSELEDRLFLFVPPHLAAFYDKEDILSPASKAAFPNGFQNLRQAGNCFAAGLNVACVFHCMRCLEYGISALARDVGVTYDDQTWHGVLKDIETAISNLRGGAAKKDRLQFLSEAASEFRHFKDAWRNYVSHNKVEYDEPQAEKVLNHVRSFIETLSVHLKE